MVEEIRDAAGNLMATVLRCRPGYGGQHFFSDPADVLQVGFARWGEGHVVSAHVHQPVERWTVGTGEVLVVLDGLIRVDLGEGEEATSVRLGTGDAIVLTPGSKHGLEVLDECRIVEIKNGPYRGRAVDKEGFAHGPRLRQPEEEASQGTADGGTVPGAG